MTEKVFAQTFPVVEETAVVEKHTAVTGIVRATTNVREDSITVDEPLRAEQVTVERVPMDIWIEAPMPVRQEGDTTIIPVVEEVAVVEKRLKLVEEVRINRRTVTRHKPQSITLRRHEVSIERSAPDTSGSQE